VNWRDTAIGKAVVCRGRGAPRARLAPGLATFFSVFLLITNLVGVPTATAVTKPAKPGERRTNWAPTPRQAVIPFQFDLRHMSQKLDLPITAKTETIAMSESVMRERVLRSKKDETVEPLQLVVRPEALEVGEMAARLARPGRYTDLVDWFGKALRGAPPVTEGSVARLVTVDRAAYPMIVPAKFAALFSRQHFDLTLDAKGMQRNAAGRDELLRQIAPFFGETDLDRIASGLNSGRNLSVDRELLPPFARSVIRRYIPWRGPNCFHAALSFQSPLFSRSSLVNVKPETGYHRAMINYDELWRIVGRAFYEVDPATSRLKYGDMLVFFETSEGPRSGDLADIDFRTIRHTATWLFDGYTFSKGSKSSNTPYTVRTMADEWATWQRYTKRLGVKVFRRSQNSVTSAPTKDLADWLY